MGLLQLNHGCSAITARLFTPTSAPACALSASPRGHFVALGLEDGSIGMLHPLANKREAEERAAEEARDASSKRQASAERAVDAARSWLEPSLRAAGYHWGGASRALSLLCCAAPESDATSLLGWLGGSSPAPVLTALEAVALEGAAPAPAAAGVGGSIALACRHLLAARVAAEAEAAEAAEEAAAAAEAAAAEAEAAEAAAAVAEAEMAAAAAREEAEVTAAPPRPPARPPRSNLAPAPASTATSALQQRCENPPATARRDQPPLEAKKMRQSSLAALWGRP